MDVGHARASHEEFQNVQNKVSVGDNVRPNVTLHATHIAGTIAGAGVNVSAQGMAPSAQISTNDWTYDAVEVADLALNQGLLISNHSYGCDTEWLGDRGYSYVFGAYINESLVWDELMYEAPYYLMVVAAGNDGTHIHNEAPLDPSFPIFDKLAGKAVAKNNLVVAASYPAEIDENGNLLDVMMATFSSQGPTDDLRIKPDITGQGVGLLSTGYNSDNEYIRMSGTSMATPNVSGTLLLLQQYVERKHKHYFRGATLKGLVLHTADDIGPKGPDAFSGWGLLNAKKAVQLIDNEGQSSRILEGVMEPGQTVTMRVQAAGNELFEASLSWTDPPGTENYNLNSGIPVLKHDLDLKITKDQEVFYPWRLTAVNQNANDGPNQVDPFEKIEIDGAKGEYLITISHKGTLPVSQKYTLILSGLAPPDNVPPVIKVKPVTISLDASGKAILRPEDVDDGSYDASGSVQLSISKSEFGCADLGDKTIKFTATDPFGNESSSDVTVVVKDVIAPTVSAKTDYTLVLDDSGKASLKWQDIDTGSLDNCAIVERTLSKAEFSCQDVGTSTVKYLLKDSSGNTTEAEVKVTVRENEAPQIKARPEVTLAFDETGKATLLWEDIDQGSTDNCSITERLLSRSVFTCSDLGSHAVSYTVKDGSGNTASAEVFVLLQDDMSPTIKAKSTISLSHDDKGMAFLKWEDIDEGSFDNCGIVDRQLSKTEFNISDGAIQVVSYTVSDIQGNKSLMGINVILDLVLSVPLLNDELYEIKLYPNPAADYLIVDMSWKAEDVVGNLAIIDVSGREIEGIEVISIEEQQLVLDISSLANGVYILKIVGSNKVVSEKFIIER